MELIDYYLKIEIAVYRTVRTKDSFRNQKTKVEKTYRELASKQTFKVLLVFIDYKLISLF